MLVFTNKLWGNTIAKKNKMKARKVKVNLGNRSYDITIAPDSLNSKSITIAPFVKDRKCFIISDSNVFPLYGEETEKMIEKNKGVITGYFVFKAGEANKTLTTVEQIYHAMLKENLDRSSVIIALGGGVVGDIAGFAAATFMRGIDFIQIPTSLLAMVDSSVGGKTGVDMQEGKNLVGAFWQPKHVLVDIKTLETLPARELKAGLAEVVKYGVILDESFFVELLNNTERIKKIDSCFFVEMIAKCCVYKAEIVKKDEKETGLRGILNFGHTFGHAIETVSGYEKYVHGEAVGIGMLMAGELAVISGRMQKKDADLLLELCNKLELKTIASKIDSEAVFAAMANDKKTKNSKICFVLPNRIGEVVFVNDLCKDIVIKAIRKFT